MLSAAQYSLTVQNRGLKHHSLISYNMNLKDAALYIENFQ